MLQTLFKQIKEFGMGRSLLLLSAHDVSIGLYTTLPHFFGDWNFFFITMAFFGDNTTIN